MYHLLLNVQPILHKLYRLTISTISFLEISCIGQQLHQSGRVSCHTDQGGALQVN